MGAVQRLATVVIIGLVALATVLVLYLADESNRIEHEQDEQEAAAIERGTANFLSHCLQCHGPAGEGLLAPGEQGTGRIGLPIGGDTYATQLNQQGLNADGSVWSDPDFGTGLEGRAEYIRNRIANGRVNSQGVVLMPAFSELKNGPLNEEQINELVIFIQNADWNEVYNEAVAEYGGYPTAPPAEVRTGEDAPTPAAETNAELPAFELRMGDNYFEPTELRIPAGTDVAINLVNIGMSDHQFRIDDLGIESDVVGSGQTGQIIVNIPEGTYQYHCPIPGHTEAGMVGQLIADPALNMDLDTGATPAPGDTVQPETEPQETAASGSESFEVNMADSMQFQPAEFSIPANTDVTVTLNNVGVLPHSFVVEGTDIASQEFDGGASGDIVINLPPGTYTFYCGVPGHREAGMVGTLIVE